MFTLDPVLEGDSRPIGTVGPAAVRMIDDARFPWLLIVPMRDGMVDLHDLAEADYASVMATVRRAGAAMKQAFGAHKINTAALGNAVRQLHIHVVARTTDDAAWPKPIWGVGEMQRMSDAQAAERAKMFLNAFGKMD